MATARSRRGIIELNTKLIARDARNAVVRLKRFNAKTVKELQVDTRRFHNRVRRGTRQDAPRDTGYMARNVESRYANDGLTGETGWWRDTFSSTAAHAGYRFYPQYPELGIGQRPQPSLRPNFHKYEASYAADCEATYQRGIKRMARDARSDGT